MKIQTHHTSFQGIDHKHGEAKGPGHHENAELDKLMRHGMDAKKLKLDDDAGLGKDAKRHAHDAKQAATKASHAEKQAAHAAKQAEHKAHKSHRDEGADEADHGGKRQKTGETHTSPVKGHADVDKPGTDVGNAPGTPAPAPASSGKRATAADGIPPANGQRVLEEPIVVKAGEVFDGKGMLFIAGKGIGDGGQGENQKPLFELEPGATLKNVQVQGGDGVHAHGDANLENVWWKDVGEDGFTLKSPGGTVNIKGGGSYAATDKMFQINAPGTVNIDGFHAEGFSKFLRQNGGKDFPLEVNISNSYLNGGEHAEAVFRTDSPQAKVTLSNNELVNVPHDVLAPDGTTVVGAVSRSYKAFTG